LKLRRHPQEPVLSLATILVKGLASYQRASVNDQTIDGDIMRSRLMLPSFIASALCVLGLAGPLQADHHDSTGPTMIIGAGQSWVSGVDSGFDIDGDLNEYHIEIESNFSCELYYNLEYTRSYGNFEQTTGTFSSFERDLVTAKIGKNYDGGEGLAGWTLSPYIGLSYLGADNKFPLGGVNVRSGQDTLYIPFGVKALYHGDDVSGGIEITGLYKFEDDQRVIPLGVNQTSKDTMSLQMEVPVRVHLTDSSFAEFKYVHRRDDFRQSGGARAADVNEHKLIAGYGFRF